MPLTQPRQQLALAALQTLLEQAPAVATKVERGRVLPFRPEGETRMLALHANEMKSGPSTPESTRHTLYVVIEGAVAGTDADIEDRMLALYADVWTRVASDRTLGGYAWDVRETGHDEGEGVRFDVEESDDHGCTGTVAMMLAVDVVTKQDDPTAAGD